MGTRMELMKARHRQVILARFGASIALLVAVGLVSQVPVAASAAPQGPWLPFTRLSDPGGSGSPRLAIGRDGTAMAAWYRSNGLIQTTTRTPGGSFGPAVDLPGSGPEAQYPALDIAPDGTTFLVWRRTTETNTPVISASIRPPGQGFGAPIDISADVPNNPDGLEVAVANDGTATVVWTREEGSSRVVESTTRAPGGPFSYPVRLSALGGSVSAPDIAVANDGTATVVWSWRDNAADSPTVVQAATRTPGGSFGSPVDLEAPAGQVQDSPSIAVANDGTATVVWSRGDYDVPGIPPKAIKVATRPPGASFGPAVELPGSRPEGGTPQIAISPDGSATVVWRWTPGDGTHVIKAATRAPGGSFTAPTDISTAGQSFERPEIAVAEDGTVTVASLRTNRPESVYATTRPPGGSFGPQVPISGSANGSVAATQQVATAPDGMATVVWWRRNASSPYDTRIETASTQIPSFSLAVTKAGSGDGTITSSTGDINCGSICSGDFKSYSEIGLTSIPAVGSRFAGWAGAGCSGTGECHLTINSNLQATAIFESDVNPPSPVATIDKVTVSGPAKVRKGKKFIYTLKIHNSGDAEAIGTKTTVRGLGIRSSSSVGKVLAGQTKTVRIKLRPMKAGKTRASFKVTSSNAGGKTVKKRITVTR